jgi:hypothetical protein
VRHRDAPKGGVAVPWVYLVKCVTKEAGTTVTTYLRKDGWLRGGHDEGIQFETREEAEAKAFKIVAKHPDLLGRLSVVRSAPF